MSWILRETIWWWGSSNPGALGNAEYSFIAIAPWSTSAGVVIPDRVLSMGQIELNCELMLNWIVCNRTVYVYKMDLALNNLQWLICHKKHKPNQTKPIMSRTLLSIQIYLNNAVVCMVSILSLISTSSNLFSKTFWTIPITPFKISLTVTLIFHSFFLFFFWVLEQGSSICLSFRFLLYSLCCQLERKNPHNGNFSFFFCLVKLTLGRDF